MRDLDYKDIVKKLVVASALVISAAAYSYSEPRLLVAVPAFNFGFSPQGATLVHRFWFKSTGTDTLIINEIKTGCSCALMPLEKHWIAPEDSMEVGIYWSVKRSLGGIVRFPRVFTNAGPDPVRLHLSATILPYPDSARPVSVRPYKFELAKSSRKDIDSLSFTLTNHSDQVLTVSLIPAPAEEVELVLPDTIPGMASRTGYVKVKPGFIDSEFQTSLTLLVSEQRQTHITIPVRRKFYGIKENQKQAK